MHYQNRWCAGWKDCWWSAPRRGKQPSKCLLFRYCTSFFLLLLFQSDFCCFSWNQLIKLTESIKGRMTGIQKHMVEIQVCYWAQVAMFRVIWSHVHPIAMAKCNTSSCWYNMWCLYVVGGLCDIYLCVRVWNIRMRQSDGFESKEFVKNRNRARDCIKCILIEVAVFYCRFVKWKIKVWYNITIPSRWIPTAKRIIIDRSLTTFTLLSHAIRIGSCLHSFMEKQSKHAPSCAFLSKSWSHLKILKWMLISLFSLIFRVISDMCPTFWSRRVNNVIKSCCLEQPKHVLPYTLLSKSWSSDLQFLKWGLFSCNCDM